MTQPRFKRPAALLTASLLAALALFGASCATMQPEPEQPVQWRLTEEAAGSYYYMVYLDAMREGQADLAEAALAELLKLDDSPSVYSDYADLKWRMGDSAGAKQMLEQGLKAHPGDPALTLRLADLAISDSQFKEAAKIMEGYLADHPDDLDTRIRLARVYLEAGMYPEALDALSKVPEEQRDADVVYLTAKAHSSLGNHKKAIEILTRLTEEQPDYILAWAELAYQYEIIKDYVAAERTYTRLLEKEDLGQEVWLRLIRLNLELNNPHRAMALTMQGPDEVDFKLEAARIFINQGFYDQAGEILEPLRESPTPELWYYLALLSFEGDKDYEQALAYLDNIPDDNQYLDQTLDFKAHLLYLMDRYDEALELVRRGKELFPEKKNFWEIESWIYEDSGKLDLALSSIDEALAKWPEDTSLMYRKALLLEAMGDQEQSLAIMEKVIARDPEFAEALNFVGYILADLNRDLDRAEVLIKAALAQKPESGYIVDSLAWVYFHQGKYDLALEKIRYAIELVDDDPTIWEHYGDIAAAAGMKEKAWEAYSKAVELGSKHPDKIKEKMDAL